MDLIIILFLVCLIIVLVVLVIGLVLIGRNGLLTLRCVLLDVCLSRRRYIRLTFNLSKANTVLPDILGCSFLNQRIDFEIAPDELVARP